MKKIAIITMVFNEFRMLPIWISHYRRHLPNATLFIIDHGSSPPVTSNETSISVVRIPRSDFDDRRRAGFVSNFHATLSLEFDLVGYVDCDELIVPMHSDSLEASLQNDDIGDFSLNAIGLNLWQRLGEEVAFSSDCNISKTRSYAVFEKAYCKPFISQSAIRWIPGFHTSTLKPYMGLGYFLFHLKYFDYQWCADRLSVTSAIEWSKEAVERNWDRNHKIGIDALTKRFNAISEQIRRGQVVEFDFSTEMIDIVEGSVLDSKGNWRCDADLPKKIVRVPAEVLERLP